MPSPLQTIELRGRILQAIRAFFAGEGYIEVETPVRIPAPALEDYIDAEPAGDGFLRTSPELDMKCLLGAGHRRIYQLGPCFRRGERGDLHNPEFTMLEWYRVEAGYREMLDETRRLLPAVAGGALGRTVCTVRGRDVDLSGPWDCRTVQSAYREWAGWDPLETFDADRFDMDMATKIEPALPRDRVCVLMDYPVQAAALARCRPGPPAVAERWEVYVGGIELANAFGELTDAVEQRRRFEACAAKRRAAGRAVYPLDERFLAVLARGLPPCAGVALGVDRLVMVLAGAGSIGQVRTFCP